VERRQQEQQEEGERAQQRAEVKRHQELERAEREQLARDLAASSSPLPLSPSPTLPPSPDPSSTHHSPASLHNLHIACTPQITATTDQPCTCAPQPSPPRKSANHPA
jgi:hypothetical protein